MFKKDLTQLRLKEVLHYNPQTGVWTRIFAIAGLEAGSIAGSIDKRTNHGYRRILIDGILYTSSRLAHLYMEGYFPEHQMDHKNRIRNDDRWCNLRHVTQQCNLKNKSMHKNNKSSVTGVSFNKDLEKWSAFIGVSSKTKHIGTFEYFNDAVKARWQAEKKYNYPNCCTSSSAFLYLNERR